MHLILQPKSNRKDSMDTLEVLFARNSSNICLDLTFQTIILMLNVISCEIEPDGYHLITDYSQNNSLFKQSLMLSSTHHTQINSHFMNTHSRLCSHRIFKLSAVFPATVGAGRKKTDELILNLPTPKS